MKKKVCEDSNNKNCKDVKSCIKDYYDLGEMGLSKDLMAPPAGLEPATYGLTVRRSTD